MPKKTVATPERETPAQNVPEQGHTSVTVSSGGAATLHNWRNIRLIIGREYKNRVTQRSFLITSIILLVIVFLAAFIPTIVQFVQHITAQPSSQTQVVVVNDAGAVAGLNEATLTSYISSQLNGTTTTSPAPYAITSQPQASLVSLQSQVKHGKLDILLVLDRSAQGNLCRSKQRQQSDQYSGPGPAAHRSRYRSSPWSHAISNTQPVCSSQPDDDVYAAGPEHSPGE